VDLTVVVIDGSDRALPGAAVRLAGGNRAELRVTDPLGEAVFLDVPCERRQVCLDEEVTERVVLSCPSPIVDLGKVGISAVFRSSFLGDLPGAGGGVSSGRPRSATPPIRCKRMAD